MKKIAIIGIGRRVLQESISRLVDNDINIVFINTDSISTSSPDPFDTTPSYLISRIPDIQDYTPFVEESSPIFNPKKHTKLNYASHKRKKRR